MSDFNFVVPLTRDELRDERFEGERYVVREVSDASKLNRKLQDCRASFVDNGPSFILQHFDEFFSVLVHFQSTDDILFRKSWPILLKAGYKLKESLSELLSPTGGNVDTRTRAASLNTLKMILYLLTQHLVVYETRLDKKNKKVMDKINRPKGGKRSRKTSASEDMSLDWNWEQQVSDVIVLIYNLVDLPLCRLFTPPVPEEQFVNMIGNACYKLLEDPDIHLVRLKSSRESVFDILGLLARNYGHSAEFVTRLLKLVRNSSEGAVSAFGRCLAAVARLHALGTLVRDVASQMVGDASGAGGEAKDLQLLVDVAEADPSAMLPCADLLTELLDREPYTLRTATLSILGEVVEHTLSTERLDEDQKAMRDEMLDEVIAHLYDVNAFVRSKTLQILLRLYKADRIPLDRSVSLLQDVIVRLKDKMANVKKFAVQLVTAYVQNNTFPTKHGEEELLVQMKALMGQEVELKAKCSHVPAHTLAAYETWVGVQQLVTECVTEVLESDKTIAEEIARGTLKKALADEEIAEHLAACRRQLDKKQIRTAFLTLLRCEAQTNMSTNGMEMADRVRFYTTVMSKVAVMLPQEGEEGETEEPTAADIWTDDPVSLLPVDRETIVELVKLKRLLHFYKLAYDTTKELNRASGIMLSLLGSSATGDVVEAINFFTVAHGTKIEGVDEGLRRMLNLTCSPEESVRGAVAASYAIVYLEPHQPTRSRTEVACANLTTLLSTVTLGQKAGLDRMMADWARAGAVGPQTCRALWDRFTMASPETTSEESVAAVVLLEMVWRSGHQLDLLSQSMVPLAKIAFGQRGLEDNRLVMYACRALEHLNPRKPDKDTVTVKLSSDHAIITSLANLLVTGLKGTTDPNYLPMCNDAIDLVYSLSLDPDITCEFILKNMCAQYESELKVVRGFLPVEQCSPNDPSHKRRSLLCMMLCRLIHCMGHVGLRQMVYMERDVLREWKRKAEEVEAETKRQKDEERQIRKDLGENEMDLDDELVGAIADDQDAETVRVLCENELLDGKNLLGLLANLTVRLMSVPEIVQCEPLFSSAFLALGKLMAVSPTFLDANIKVLVTFALRCSSPAVRSNFAIILRDLSFRFPTAMEPHLPDLFTCLRDENDEVRENAMLCSATLILSQMVKVKSCVTDLALCMLDANKYMATSAKELFTRMSQRGNDLYNAMPDIISRLTNEEVEEQHFDKIMTFIMGLIQKDRHHESLVEKLCTRLRYAEKERHWRDLAYCLSLIVYNERSLRKLVDNFQCYADKFEHRPVLQYFETIRDKATRQAKPELKSVLDELEMKMNGSSAKETEKEGNEADGEKEPAAPPPQKKKGRGGRQVGAARRGRAPARKPRRGRAARSPSPSSSGDSS